MEEEAPKKKEEKENENEEEEEKEENEECNMKKEIKENENEEEEVEDEECNENEEEEEKEENEECNMKKKEENKNENEEEEEVDDEECVRSWAEMAEEVDDEDEDEECVRTWAEMAEEVDDEDEYEQWVRSWAEMAEEVDDEECKRDWAEMLPEMLSQALARVSVRDMFSGVSLVCRAWRDASLDPVCWQRLDLRDRRDWPSGFTKDPLHVERMVRLLIDRSAGRLTHFFISYHATDSILHYIADRCPSLRCLHLANSIHLTDSVFCELAHKFPFLEELDISGCADLSSLTLTKVGQCCKGLLCLKRNGTGSMHTDEEAFAIAKTMPWLKHLEMSDSQISKEGLLALLEGCKDLEYLDVKNCRNLTIGKEMVEKCFKGKEFHISEWDEYLDQQFFSEEENWLYDTEIMFHDTVMQF